MKHASTVMRLALVSIGLGLACFVAALVVTGCGGSNPDPSTPGGLYVTHVQVDGRRIACINRYVTSVGVAISCDWGNKHG